MTVRPEEKEFMLRVWCALEAKAAGVNTWAQTIITEMSQRPVNPVPEKRLWYWLGKWSDRNWWDYGVSLRSGWFTDEGKARVAQLIAERKAGC